MLTMRIMRPPAGPAAAVFARPVRGHWATPLSIFDSSFQHNAGRSSALVPTVRFTGQIQFTECQLTVSRSPPPATSQRTNPVHFLLYLHGQNDLYLYSYPLISHKTNREWAMLSMYKNMQILLLISGIEENPGPVIQNSSNKLSLAHVNINSITTPGKLDELQQFVDNNDIHMLRC